MQSLLEVLAVSTKLGLTSFGGPIAHLGYFHNEYIRRRRWLDEQTHADLVALTQFLPGPASSQVGIGIGVLRSGLLGGLVAWMGFTLPSVIVLVLFAFLLQGFDIGSAGWIHGLKVVSCSRRFWADSSVFRPTWAPSRRFGLSSAKKGMLLLGLTGGNISLY